MSLLRYEFRPYRINNLCFRNKLNSTGKDGSLVVISHDRDFCEKVGFTHIGTVMDGKLILEQVSPPHLCPKICFFITFVYDTEAHLMLYSKRALRESDWEQYDIGAKLQ